MKITQIPIDQITPYAYNPRQISGEAVQQVAASIERFGFQQPIICDKKKVVIAGHTRLSAAKQLGMKKVPVVIADKLTITQANALRVVDNLTHDLTEWDAELLQSEVAAIFGSDKELMQGFELPPEFYGAKKEDDDTPGGEGEPKQATVCPACGHEW